MYEKLRITAAVAAAIILILFASDVVYFLGPPFAWIHDCVFFFSTIGAIVGLPVLAYQYAVRDADQSRRVIWILISIWCVCAFMKPRVEHTEMYSVLGVTEASEGYAATQTHWYHCFEDATRAARTLYTKRNSWSGQYGDGQVQKCDVKINVVSHTPSLEWFNLLCGTEYGTDVDHFTIRLLDEGRDPLGVAPERGPYVE